MHDFFSKKVFIVAEVGNNHEGDIRVAFKLVDKAKECGVSAVKFQTFNTDHFLSSDYSNKSIKRMNKFQLNFEDFYKISEYCKKKKITFFSTPLDISSVIFLNKIQNIFKISSGDNDFYDLIDEVKKLKKPIIISSGMQSQKNISKIIKYIKSKWIQKKEFLTLLQCTSAYPAAIKNVNLNVITNFIKKYKNINVGYSDHTIGVDAAIFSSALGAKVIEKHFTLDHNFSKFRDHQISANPNEMLELVEKVRLFENLKGSFKKVIQKDEVKNIINAKRSIATNKDLKKGEKITKNDIIFLRPAIGLIKKSRIVGKKINVNLKKNSIIKNKYLYKNDSKN